RFTATRLGNCICIGAGNRRLHRDRLRHHLARALGAPAIGEGAGLSPSARQVALGPIAMAAPYSWLAYDGPSDAELLAQIPPAMFEHLRREGVRNLLVTPFVLAGCSVAL